MGAATHSFAGAMIRPLTDKGVGERAPFVGASFILPDRPPKNAALHITALGLYRAFLNGARVGDDQLTPGWTCYRERLAYQTYDVAKLLKPGVNTIEIWLGDGWLRSQMMWARHPIYNTWGREIGALCDLVVDGAIAVKTGEDWKSGVTPILKNGIYLGEHYDARLAVAPASGGVAKIAGFDPATLLPHEIGGVKELAAFAPIATFADAQGRTVYDFGQNAAAYVRFTARGEAGARIVVDHAEILDKGAFSNANMRSAEVRLEYTLKGGEAETYSPIFTFMGFRYARVAIEGKATIEKIESVPITSATAPAGEIATGHALVNRLVENTRWSLRSNFVEVPTDCPQRDERLGWTGDAQVFAPTACYLNKSQAFWRKWLRDLMADQRPDGAIPHVSPDPTRGHEDVVPGFYGSTGWGDAIVIVPWTLYLHYGDRDALKETLPAMVRWVDFLWSISNGPVISPPRKWGSRGFSFGDWLQPSGSTEKPFPVIGEDAAATIYHYISTRLVARIAGLLGEAATAADMTKRADAIQAAFADEFITASGRLAYDDQTSYALAFVHDLIPPAKREAAKGYFKRAIARADGRLQTGFIGTPALLPALVKIGEAKLAADLFLQEEVPGWLYQVKNGATTIWERWDAIKPDGSVFAPDMNSYNHYAYGAVCQWLFEGVGGFRPDPDMPGFKRILFDPTPIAALGSFEARHDSAAGTIAAKWSLKDGHASYEFTIPEGAEGLWSDPARHPGLEIDGRAAGPAPVSIGAGTHRARFRW